MSETQYTPNDLDSETTSYGVENPQKKNKVPLIRTSTVIAFCLGTLIGLGSVILTMSIIDGMEVPVSNRVGTRADLPTVGQVPNPNAPLSGFTQPANGSANYQQGEFNLNIDGAEDPPPPGTEIPGVSANAPAPQEPTN